MVCRRCRPCQRCPVCDQRRPHDLQGQSTTCGRARAFVTKLCSGTKRWEPWVAPTARSTCACCVGLWTLGHRGALGIIDGSNSRYLLERASRGFLRPVPNAYLIHKPLNTPPPRRQSGRNHSISDLILSNLKVTGFLTRIRNLRTPPAAFSNSGTITTVPSARPEVPFLRPSALQGSWEFRAACGPRRFPQL